MALRFHLPDVRDRARAAFVGAALGDALGATVEFMTAGEIRAAHGVHRELTGGGWLRLAPGAVTDDTEMSIAVAEAVLEHGCVDPAPIARHLAAWLRGRPADVGNTVRRGLRRYLVEGTLHGPPSAGDGGNGAAMRVVPIALATLADGARLRRDAVVQGRITHHHPLSDAACVAVGDLVHLGCLGLSRARLRRAADALALAYPPFRFAPYRGLSSGYVADTLATVLHFLFATGSFEECLVAVVNQGGDADTTGAIAGAIAGAYHGPGGLPPRWLRRLAPGLVSRLETLADGLLALSPLAQGEPPALAGAPLAISPARGAP